MVAFTELITLPTLKSVKDTCLQLARDAGLPVDVWILGSPSERWLEIMARLVHAFVSTSTTQAIRGFFLDYATDPGDEGDLSADQTQRPGWLSALGFSWYGVQRGGQTYATGTVTIRNTGSTSTLAIKPFDLTFQRATVGADGGQPTYRNSEDPSIYTGLGGTITLSPGSSITIPVIAEQIGSYATASASLISICITQTFGQLTVTASTAAIGSDRESATLYRARCRIAASRLAHGGPGTAYRYAANTALDGTPLQRFDGSGAVGITRVYVSAASATGHVTVYYADPDGPADAVDVSSANANITGIAIGAITEPMGVLPDAVIILPQNEDPNTGGPGGAAAIGVDIRIAGTAKVRVQPGGITGFPLVVAAQQAVLLALDDAFAGFDIGGLDQVDGAGVIYTSDLACTIRDAYEGLYAVTLSSPAGGTTPIAEGHVAVHRAMPLITNAVNDDDLIKITAAAHGLLNGQTVQIYDVEGTTEANGTWVVSDVTTNDFILVGSVFVHAYVSGGTISRLVLTVVP